MSHHHPTPPDPHTGKRGNAITRAVTSLKSSRDFRFLWLTNLLFIGGNWGLILVMSWLVYDTTDSEFLLAVFTAVRLSPMWFGPLAGLMADRYDRALIIKIASLWAAAIMAALAGLHALDLTPFWVLLVAGFLAGLSQSPSQPARSSLALQLVGRANLANANALTSMGFGLTQAIAPAVGGIILASFGATIALLYTTAWYLAAALMISQVRPVKAMVRRDHEPMLAMIVDGLRIIRVNRLTMTVLVITLASNVFIWPIQNSFLAVFASDVLALGPDGLGRLMMFMGIGNFTGSFIIASMGDFRGKGAMFVIGCMVWGVSWALFGLSELPALSYALIAITGLVSATFSVLQATLMLMTSVPEVQGRALGILELVIGSMPLGTLLLGTIANQVGVGPTTFMAGAAFVLIVAVHTLRVPDLLRYTGEDDPPVIGV